jgi:hypothetical protein
VAGKNGKGRLMHFLGALSVTIARPFLTFTRNRKSSRFANRDEAGNDPL